MNRIALALAVAAVSVSAAAAQSSRKTTWDDLTKPYQAKTNPNVPLAPPAPPPAPATPQTGGSDKLLDACVIEAIGRLPKVDGLRVTNTSHEFLEFNGMWDLWTVSVSVDLNGRRASYQWRCGTRENTAKLFP